MKTLCQHPGSRHDAATRVAGRPTREGRLLGIDVGAETIKLVELVTDGNTFHWVRERCVEHGKEPGRVLAELLQEWDWAGVERAAITGRFSRRFNLPRVPVKQAQARGFRFLEGQQPATVVSIGSHGFSVLELRGNGVEVYRENSRCSQGTGNFLRQLIERFSVTIQEASALAATVKQAHPLSGRCPVILKSDMTHLANKGEDRARILAGLFDAVCENVLALIKPATAPKRVVLVGGLSRSARVRDTFRDRLAAKGMALAVLDDEDGLYLEALGAALVASESPTPPPALSELVGRHDAVSLLALPPLSAFAEKVHRMAARPFPESADPDRPLILGLDIGSTGSKAVALDAAGREALWEGYRRTLGDPTGAAQALVKAFLSGPAGKGRVAAVGVTGSGREIVGSLMATCFGKESVFILNEIAAHAEGALHFDARVDTIFEIGGQDAKYISLAGGRVIDCAMNEACSAGTGSFIEEQGRKFAGVADVQEMAREAMAAPRGVSLGQHCSVFMAEIIDEAVAAGIDRRSIMAGLYDSVVQNYLNRVKGNRSIGQVIFCQGMPFASDALAAAVARQTGCEVIVPPNPGTVGALGIALLAQRELPWRRCAALDLNRFLGARVEAKETFVCRATTGCGGAGNRCRIERLRTLVEARSQSFTWGGGCSLHDKGLQKRKLPDLAPDPFREREALVQAIICERRAPRGGKSVALTDEFMLKGLVPFFATFFHGLGLDPHFVGGGDQGALKRGVQDANVAFCAPMQLFHGLVSRMAETGADWLFLPMMRSLPRVDGERFAVTCPIVQASPDLVRWDLKADLGGRVLSPVFDVAEGNFDSGKFRASCQRLAGMLGVPTDEWERAFTLATQVQADFDRRCLEIGQRALEFCSARQIPPVVVLGRPYTIHNTVLNSNVPALLRELGSIGIPVDCYPVDAAVPIFHRMYWSYGQRILRAAHQIRRTPGVYSLYCSNYSCGPDSFCLHFYGYVMEGKPFAIIETDGHSGDAGTKTRVEAFLHCVHQDLRRTDARNTPRDFRRMERESPALADLREGGRRLLIPYMGPASEIVAAGFRGLGLATESLPMPDGDSLRLGRRHTSGKECLPMCLTLGNLLKRLEQDRASAAQFNVMMPGTNGPCREGTYNLLNEIVLERSGWRDRVRIWAPMDAGYFDDLPAGFAMRMFTGMMASDLLLDALHYVRPVETRPGAAAAIYRRWFARLTELLERKARRGVSLPAALWQVAGGGLFGVKTLLDEASAEFASVCGSGALPTVLVTGEIYLRCDPFSNDFVIAKLEARGLRARLVPTHEQLDYAERVCQIEERKVGWAEKFSLRVRQGIQHASQRRVARALGWPEFGGVPEALAAVQEYIRPALLGEAVLTVGTPLHEWRQRRIAGVISVGPLECMPNKVAESQFFHVTEREGLPALTLSMNGDPIDPEVLDNFAFEIRARFRNRAESKEETDAACRPASELVVRTAR